MAAATSKAILISTTRHDKKVYSHPVAVFANATDAKGFVTFMKLAHRAGDTEAAKALDPDVVLDADGNLAKDVKYSIMVTRYNPAPYLEDDDTEVDDATATE